MYKYLGVNGVLCVYVCVLPSRCCCGMMGGGWGKAWLI